MTSDFLCSNLLREFDEVVQGSHVYSIAVEEKWQTRREGVAWVHVTSYVLVLSSMISSDDLWLDRKANKV